MLRSGIVEALDFEALLRGGTCFSVDSSRVDDCGDDSDPETTEETLQRMKQYANLEVGGLHDEDSYEEGEPFERIARKMENLTPDGKIKKRIIREGTGDPVKDMCRVKVDYNAYQQYQQEPFDSTYARNRPHRFLINNGDVILGLNLAVMSMRVGEKSQFLIDPDYAYKKVLIGRIDPNGHVLFEVELLEVVDVSAIMAFENLSIEEQHDFGEIYKYALAICERGKQNFASQDIKAAIRDYNLAVGKLMESKPTKTDDIVKHRELCLKLYSNLVICNSRPEIHQPRKACDIAKKIYQLTDNGNLLNISPKVYYNHARCLRSLNEYDEAKQMLGKARKFEPKNPDIANEYMNLERDMREHQMKRMPFAEALVGEKKS